MRVKRLVNRPLQLLRHRPAKEKCKDSIVLIIRFVLIRRQHNESTVVVESRVLQQRDKPELEPSRQKCDIGVVCVVDHVRCDKHPLRESVCVDVRRKVVEVAYAFGALRNGGNGVIYNETVVFAHVEGVGRVGCVEVVGLRKAAR